MQKLYGEQEEENPGINPERKIQRKIVNDEHKKNSYLMNDKELKESLNKKDVELHLLRDPIYCDNTIKFMQNNCKSLMNQINT